MKDFVSRITFGFLMAQLFPGALTVFALTFAYRSFDGVLADSIVDSIDGILRIWYKASIAHQLFLFGLFVAFGMLIHGMHWMILGTLEQVGETTDPKPDSMFDRELDRRPLWCQFLYAPLRVFEELKLVGQRQGVIYSAVRENVARIGKDWMAQHEFMQDFYLYTAQFFAHTSYALNLCILVLLAYVARFNLDHLAFSHVLVLPQGFGLILPQGFEFTYGLNLRRAFLLLLLYAGSSVFLILARIQLSTLFRAEQDLIAYSANQGPREWPPQPRPAKKPAASAATV